MDNPLVSNSVPSDDVPDAELGPVRAARRAVERYPLSLLVLPGTGATLRNVFMQRAQEQFKTTLARIDPGVVAKLEQPFGKDNLDQCFTSEASLRHVLLPLWKSGMLVGCIEEWESLCTAYYPTAILRDLLDKLADVPFYGIRGYNPNWEAETEVDDSRVQMATAALLYFNGCVADLVRWIGGPHVGAHRDHQKTFALMKQAGVDMDTQANLQRIFQSGIPAKCAVSSTEKNFEAYYRYGNHTTVNEEPQKTYKAMVKDSRKGFILILDKRAVLLILHCHLTPQGVVDLNTLFKNPRPIFDSSFRPYVWCYAINDWTHKDNEPTLTFAGAELGFMIWLYNLRITYPDLEIYIADDDVSGAFRLMKYHPNCMALHTSIQCGYCVINTGGTFGDNTSPSNFDPIGMARRQLSQYLWRTDPTVVARVKPHLPPMQLAAPPTHEEVRGFVLADADDLNPGVLTPEGARRPPPYHMHVDDNLYADVAQFLELTICSSVGGLFEVLGPPTNPLVPSPLSGEKFKAFYNHERKLVGRKFNSRTLSVGLLPHKREQLEVLLRDWLSREKFELLGIAQLLGILENHTKYARWARCWYSSLQNAVRRVLEAWYHMILRRFTRDGQKVVYKRELSPSLYYRIQPLIARDRARLLWTARATYTIDPEMRISLSQLLCYVVDVANPWEVPLGMIIPREPHFWSRGDASHAGGGAYCPGLSYWFDVVWSPRVLSKGLTFLPVPLGMYTSMLS